MDVAGFVALAIFTAFFAYLLPSVIRSRQVVLDSRVEDRFSAELRVLARAGDAPAQDRRESSTRGYLHRPRSDDPEATMHPPAPQRERLVAADARRAAAARAARAAAASRRAAAANRRLALTLVLLAATAGAWVLYAVASAPVLAAIVPSVLLVGVVYLGRRAAAQAAVADERWQAELARERKAGLDRSSGGPRVKAATSATSRPAASLRIDVDPAALLPDAPEEGTGRQRAMPDLPEGEGWTPIPVPAPTYTLKPAAPRRAVAPMEMPEPVTQAPATPAVDDVETAPPAPAPAVPAMNLQAVLERRRAAGQ